MTSKPSAFFANWASVLVVQSVQSSKSHDQCHFYLGGKIAFSIKVRDRLLTELWLLLQSPRPCIFFSQPPSNTQTYQPMHWHSHKREHAKPPNVHQSLFPHQIHKVYLTWALTQREHFPIVSPLWGNTLTNSCGFKLFPLEGAFTH